MLKSLPSPVIFAHRGASAHAPENTLTAFKLAINQSADAIEFDVQLSADQVPVVFHDSTVNRTTDGFGKVNKLSLNQLKLLNAGFIFNSNNSYEPIPTLEEVLSELPPAVLLNIELKNLSSPLDPLPRKVAEIIKSRNFNNRILLSSFNPIALIRINKILPDYPIGLLLAHSITIDFLRNLSFMASNYQSVHIPHFLVTSPRVNYFHQLGKRVFVYTLNHSKDILDVLAYGVDGFFTNDPNLARQTIQDQFGQNEIS